MADNLPITKDQFIDGIIPFVNKYKRLPYLSEDNIIVIEIDKKKNEEIEKPYRASRYIREYFDTQDKLSEYLLDDNIITYELISEITKLTPTIIKNIMSTTTKNPDMRARRQLDIFFNCDFYEGKLSGHADMCDSCTKRNCKQAYWVEMVGCSRYKESKRKRK